MTRGIVLDRRVTLLEPQAGQGENPWGQTVQAAPLQHPVWAMRRDLRANERVVQQGTLVALLDSIFTIRYRPDITSAWTLRTDDGREWLIEGTRQVDRRRWLELLCLRVGVSA